MEDYKSLYILGESIKTNIGDIRFIKVNEYPKLLEFIPYLKLKKVDILEKLFINDRNLALYFRDKDMIEIIKGLSGSNYEIYDVYKDMFVFFFNKDVFDEIETDEELEIYRTLIKHMNHIQYEEENPNPEIQYFNNLKKIYDERQGLSVTFESMVSSVWLRIGNPLDLTIYQLKAIFNRLCQDKNYDTSTLFRTVDDSVKIDSWLKHVDMFEERKKETVTLEQLRNDNIFKH